MKKKILGVKKINDRHMSFYPKKQETSTNNVPNNNIEIDSEQQAIEIELDKYKLRDNTKLCIVDTFSQDFYKVIVDKIYNYETTIVTENDDIDLMYYVSQAIRNNIFIDLLIEDFELSDDGKTITIKYAYETNEERDEKLKEAEKIMKNVIMNAKANDANKMEMVLSVYTYWATNISYDYDSADPNDGKIPTIEDVIFEHKGICQNYSSIISYTLNQMGIECYDMGGDVASGEPHAWNMVKIYGDYYQFDATFENGITEGKGLSYFGLTKEDMLEEGRIFSKWNEGFEYSDFSDKESDKLKMLQDAIEYKVENHVLTLYNEENEEYAKMDTYSLEIIE